MSSGDTVAINDDATMEDNSADDHDNKKTSKLKFKSLILYKISQIFQPVSESPRPEFKVMAPGASLLSILTEDCKCLAEG